MLLNNFVFLIGKLEVYYDRLTKARNRIGIALKGSLKVEISIHREMIFGISKNKEQDNPAIFSTISIATKESKSLTWEAIVHCDEDSIICEWILWSDNNGEDAQRWSKSAYFQDIDSLFDSLNAFCEHVETVTKIFGIDFMRFLEEPYDGPDFDLEHFVRSQGA